MKVLVTGASGQLGREVIRNAPGIARITACDSTMLDVRDQAAVAAMVLREQPEVIINAAAYTAVDRAESEEVAAMAVNGRAVDYLAAAASLANARLVHVSTDFVFAGTSGTPYPPDAATTPLGAYGRTKLAGEQAAGPHSLIVRTAWLYGPSGANFVRTMLRLMAERPEVRVVVDQIGTPTYAPGLARALWRMAEAGLEGIYHYTDSGVCSWYDFAVAIQEEALAAGLLASPVPVIPIPTRDFPTPALRPAYSVLDKSSTFAFLGQPAPHWRDNLRSMMAEIKIYG